MRLEDNPIIAAVRTGRELEGALGCEVPLIFLLSGSILTLKDTLRRIHAEKKRAFVHIDLTEGIGKDNAGLAFLAELGADGIISTRAGLIRAAKDCGLETVQRFFLVDSHSVETAIESIRACNPSMVELMPGVVPKVIRRFCGEIRQPVIAGGLIETREEAVQALSAGAAAISTAQPALWREV